MKKILFISLFILSTLNFYCQEEKFYYVGERFLEIPKVDFEKDTDRLEFFKFTYSLDTAIIYLKVPREFKGKLKKNSLNTLKEQLERSSETKIDSNQILVLNYHPGNDECNEGLDRSLVTNLYKKYLNKIKKLNKVSQFFIYKEINGVKNYGSSLIWFPDPNNIIEKTFFMIHYPCASSVIIKPDGNYIALRGEHYIGYILEILDDK